MEEHIVREGNDLVSGADGEKIGCHMSQKGRNKGLIFIREICQRKSHRKRKKDLHPEGIGIKVIVGGFVTGRKAIQRNRAEKSAFLPTRNVTLFA